MGKPVNHVYQREDLVGWVNIWRIAEGFVITWEECRRGDEYNEHLYTIDVRKVFDSVDAVIAFLAENGFSVENFRPV